MSHGVGGQRAHTDIHAQSSRGERRFYTRMPAPITMMSNRLTATAIESPLLANTEPREDVGEERIACACACHFLEGRARMGEVRENELLR